MNQAVDKNNLSQRELLILVADRQETMNQKMDKLSGDYIELHTRVTKLETRQQTIAAAWGVGSVILTIINNLLKFWL